VKAESAVKGTPAGEESFSSKEKDPRGEKQKGNLDVPSQRRSVETRRDRSSPS